MKVQPSSDSDNPSQEWVELENQGPRTVDLQGYTLRNGNGESFTFPNVMLAPLRRVRVYTGSGTDDETALYWNASAPVWGQAHQAILVNASGAQVDQLEY